MKSFGWEGDGGRQLQTASVIPPSSYFTIKTSSWRKLHMTLQANVVRLVSVSWHSARHQIVIKVNKSWNLFFMGFHSAAWVCIKNEEALVDIMCVRICILMVQIDLWNSMFQAIAAVESIVQLVEFTLNVFNMPLFPLLLNEQRWLSLTVATFKRQLKSKQGTNGTLLCAPLILTNGWSFSAAPSKALQREIARGFVA